MKPPETYTYPVLFTGDDRELTALDCPRRVPWSLLAPHDAQALRNHGQTLERLAERGGLGPDEMVAIIEGRRWQRMTNADAVAALKRYLSPAPADPTPAASSPERGEGEEYTRGYAAGWAARMKGHDACWKAGGELDRIRSLLATAERERDAALDALDLELQTHSGSLVKLTAARSQVEALRGALEGVRAVLQGAPAYAWGPIPFGYVPMPADFAAAVRAIVSANDIARAALEKHP